jgi:hypothetical protein
MELNPADILRIVPLLHGKCLFYFCKVKYTWNIPVDFFLIGLMVFNAPFNNISVISYGGLFYWWRKPEDPKKTTDLSQVTEKLYHIILYTSPWSRFKLTTSVVIGTDCIDSCKSNYQTITATEKIIKKV